MIDRKQRQRNGALALRRVGKTWELTAARPDGHDRPWARAAAPPNEAPAAASSTRPGPRDATPNMDDLDPGD